MKRIRTDEYRAKQAAAARKRRAENPEHAAMQRKKDREKLLADPERYQRSRDNQNGARTSRYATDPKYREMLIEAQHRSYRKLRTQILEAYGSKCMCCGETEPIFLEIDHVNGGGSKHYRSESANTAYRRIIKAGFPQTFQLLCCNCNRGRARCGGICPHKRVTQ